MKNKHEFHGHLIKAVIALFILPIATFLATIHIGINERICFLASIGLFVFILNSITMKTIKQYSKKTKKL